MELELVIDRRKYVSFDFILGKSFLKKSKSLLCFEANVLRLPMFHSKNNEPFNGFPRPVLTSGKVHSTYSVYQGCPWKYCRLKRHHWRHGYLRPSVYFLLSVNYILQQHVLCNLKYARLSRPEFPSSKTPTYLPLFQYRACNRQNAFNLFRA